MNKYFIFLLTFLLVCSSSFAKDYLCPPSIKTIQKLETSAPSGWESYLGGSDTNSLKRIAISESHPRNIVWLAPEDSKGTTIFSKDASIWMTCEYHGSSLWLVKELPKGATRCTPIVKKGKSDPPEYEGWACK